MHGDASINTTALVHEARLKLRDSPELAAKSIPHFKSIAAKAMRQVLVDEARRRNALKRGSAAGVKRAGYSQKNRQGGMSRLDA
jgi:ECF sigma factor